ncbi:MAG: DUF892 family protein [Pseudomonadota bacterium]
MPMNNLKDVYLDQLQDLYSACDQSHLSTLKLMDAASDAELTQALKDGAKGIESGMAELKALCDGHEIDPKGEHCKGMEGLVREAKAHALEATFGDDAARDAMIITQYQRMVHYAIAGYGCLVAFADRLGFDADASVLRHLLEDTYGGDRRTTGLAAGSINKKAA